MTYIHSIALGIVEGITEFLPISSTAHLAIFGNLIGIKDDSFYKTFEVAIQSGAILAVVILYAKKILTNKKHFINVLFAFIPTMILGFLFYGFIKKIQGNMLVIGSSLLLGGIVFLLVEKYLKKRELNSENNREVVSQKDAFWLGFFQSVAFIPGVSRSGATIITGLLNGLSRKAVVEFSFLLAIPTMLSATLLDLLKTGSSFSKNEWGLIIVGATTSLIVAFFALKSFLRFIQKNTFTVFGWYRIIVGLIILFISIT